MRQLQRSHKKTMRILMTSVVSPHDEMRTTILQVRGIVRNLLGVLE